MSLSNFPLSSCALKIRVEFVFEAQAEYQTSQGKRMHSYLYATVFCKAVNAFLEMDVNDAVWCQTPTYYK